VTLTAPPALVSTGAVVDGGRPRVPTALVPRLAAARVAARPQRVGRVSSAVGLGLTVQGLDAAVGEIVAVGDATSGGADVGSNLAEVVATTPDGVRCMPLGVSAPIRV